MPFTSRKQESKCFALRARGEAGSWDCTEWAHATDQKHLPERAKQASPMPMGDELQQELASRPPMSPELAAAIGVGVGGAGGAGIGGVLGTAAGAMRGNTPEGLGRGIVRGGATGAGAMLGSHLGSRLGASSGYPLASSLLGAGLGGAAGYLGAGKLMGPPESDREDEKYASIKSAAPVGSLIQRLLRSLGRTEVGGRINKAMEGTDFITALRMRNMASHPLGILGLGHDPLEQVARSSLGDLGGAVNHHFRNHPANLAIGSVVDKPMADLGIEMTPLRRAGLTAAGTGAVGKGTAMLGSGIAGALSPPPDEPPALKAGRDFGASVAARPYITKLAADMRVTPALVEHLAGRAGVSPVALVKWAYADPDRFVTFLCRVTRPTKQAGVAELLGRLKSTAGKAYGHVDDALQIGLAQAPKQLNSTPLRRAATTGTAVGVTGAGLYNQLAGGAAPPPTPAASQVPGAQEAIQSMHAPNPVKPLAASGSGGMAPAPQAPQTTQPTKTPATPPVGVRGSGTTGPGKGLSPSLKGLMIGGGLGVGGMAAGAAMGRRGRRKADEEKEASARVLAGLRGAGILGGSSAR